MSDTDVSRSYQASTIEEQQSAYDNWALKYEQDLCAMGYRIPANIASVFVQFVAKEAAPILDAGCGGGIQAEPLALLGYRSIHGMDLSDGMLDVARSKSFYTELKQMAMGERLDYPDNHFAATLCSGTITPGHAPPHSFEELIRVTQPGALVIFTLRTDPKQLPEYPQTLDRLESEGKWKHVFTTSSFHSMPYGEPEITHAVYVYEVI